MKRSAPSALGNIWGMFSILFSLVVMFVLFAPEEIGLLGIYSVFTQSILSHMNSINSFSSVGYAVAISGFILCIIGLIGACVSRRHNILGGIFLLGCCSGVFWLFYAPFLFGAKGTLTTMQNFIDFGMVEIVAFSFLTIAVTLIGIAGGILALIPKKAPLQAFSGAGGYYGQQPYGQPNQPIQPIPEPQKKEQHPNDPGLTPPADDTE